MTHYDSFQRTLDADPTASAVRLVLADWLEERGDPRAEAWRWLGDNGIVPDGRFGSWDWYPLGFGISEVAKSARIPVDQVRIRELGLWRGFPTRQAAEEAFVRAWPALRPLLMGVAA